MEREVVALQVVELGVGGDVGAVFDDFIEAVAAGKSAADENAFASATQTDKTMAMIIENAETGQAVGEARAAAPEARKKRGWFGR